VGAERETARILLTGGTGFFGRALLRNWMNEEQGGRPVPHVTVLTRDPQRFLDEFREFKGRGWLAFHAGDILDPASLPREGPVTHVLHAAADSRLGPRLPPLVVYRQIADGTRNMLDFAVRVGATRFLFVSSGAVYGRQPHDLAALPESWTGSPDPTDPRSAYGMAKRAGEHFCALYRDQYGLETIIARCFAFVGPDLALDVHFAIGNFIRDALWRDAIRIEGDGESVRSYLHQNDLAAWLCAILMAARPGTIYNVGSPHGVTIAELAQRVRDSLAPGKIIQRTIPAGAASPSSRYVPDVSSITKDLGVGVSIPLGDAITLTAGVLRAMRKP
jgi:UDP-glucuronate decarboxylase